METLQERTERRFRRGGLFFVLVGGLAALYALSLHHGSSEPPTYGLALAWLLDSLGRTADRVGGLLGGGWEERAFQVNLAAGGAFAACGAVAWLGSRIHRVFLFLGFVPRLFSRLLYLLAFAVYATDTVVAIGLEIGMRRMFHLPTFAMPGLVLHGLILAVLLYGLGNGMYVLVEILGVLANPGKALRKARKGGTEPEPPAGASQAPGHE